MSTYPLPQVPIAPASFRLRLVQNQSVATSIWTGSQTVVQNYASWKLDLTFARMNFAKAEALVAWLDSLKGAYGTFYYQPRHSITYAGVPTYLASTVYPTSNTASIAGFAFNAPTNLKVGKFIQIGQQLVRIAAAPLFADSAGNATIEFNPPARSQIGAGSTVETQYPHGIFRLVPSSGDDGGSGFQIDPDRIPEFVSIAAVEAI